MPELPDVELFKRRLEATSLRRKIVDVVVSDRRLLSGVTPAGLRRALIGRRFRRARRHGKHLLAAMDDGTWLTLHFGMTGGLEHFKDLAGDPPYDRVRIDFADGHHLAYTSKRLLGRVGLAKDAKAFLQEQGLGPDALDPSFDFATFKAVLRGKRRDIKSTLMAQDVLAGIGNIYSDEILFQARVHPKQGVDQLDERALKRVFSKLKRVLTTAIDRGAGSEMFLDRLPRTYLLPQRRAGGTCPRCRGHVAQLRIAGRTAYFCRRCQPPARGASARA